MEEGYTARARDGKQRHGIANRLSSTPLLAQQRRLPEQCPA